MTNQMRCAAGLVALTLLSGVAAGAGINETLLAAIRDGNAARIRTALQQGAARRMRVKCALRHNISLSIIVEAIYAARICVGWQKLPLSAALS